ncbi:MAG: hypothetical protein WC422_03860 [Candidatus Paceibacterota bacterium]|jgi:hypothetical protein
MLYRNDATVRIIFWAEKQAIDAVLKEFSKQLYQELMKKDEELKIYFQSVSGADKINFPDYYKNQMEIILKKYDEPFYKRIVEQSNTILEKQLKCMNNDCQSSLRLIYHGYFGRGIDYETYERNHDISLFFHGPKLSYRYNLLSCDENFDAYEYRKGNVEINRIRCQKCGEWFCHRCIVMLGDESRERHGFEYICPNCISRMNLSMY